MKRLSQHTLAELRQQEPEQTILSLIRYKQKDNEGLKACTSVLLNHRALNLPQPLADYILKLAFEDRIEDQEEFALDLIQLLSKLIVANFRQKVFLRFPDLVNSFGADREKKNNIKDIASLVTEQKKVQLQATEKDEVELVGLECSISRYN
eukprot:TRINITY_DN3659_c0_g2_i2.p1 TRINITY_DN3659_c0_g2~~TRINITY_DN3659_c0_g2_i2.p1  ORF type:complete len:151 (-),score=27.76 TRINITY_DN3659_c0_g2_i2:427-879(-)